MAKPKEIKGYIYCSLCDIYYPRKFFDKAEEEKAKRLKSKDEHIRRMAHNITGCPMCQSKIREAILSLSSHSGNRHCSASILLLKDKTIRFGKTPKKYIFIDKVKK